MLDAAARDWLERIRWPNGPICPRCKEGAPYRLSDGRYRCSRCRVDFTARVGTVLERSHIGLDKWLTAAYLLREGFNCHQLHRTLGVTYKTARRLREGILKSMGEITNVMASEETLRRADAAIKDSATAATRGRRGRPPSIGKSRCEIFSAAKRLGSVAVNSNYMNVQICECRAHAEVITSGFESNLTLRQFSAHHNTSPRSVRRILAQHGYSWSRQKLYRHPLAIALTVRPRKAHRADPTLALRLPKTLSKDPGRLYAFGDALREEGISFMSGTLALAMVPEHAWHADRLIRKILASSDMQRQWYPAFRLILAGRDGINFFDPEHITLLEDLGREPLSRILDKHYSTDGEPVDQRPIKLIDEAFNYVFLESDCYSFAGLPTLSTRERAKIAAEVEAKLRIAGKINSP